MKCRAAIAILLLLLVAPALASDDPGPGGLDVHVNSFRVLGSVGAWRYSSPSPRFWVRRWRNGHEVLVAARAKCGADRATRPRAKLDGHQLALFADFSAKPWDRGACEYRVAFKVDHLPKSISPLLFNSESGPRQLGWLGR